jgi:hypothetical protein
VRVHEASRRVGRTTTTTRAAIPNSPRNWSGCGRSIAPWPCIRPLLHTDRIGQLLRGEGAGMPGRLKARGLTAANPRMVLK